MMKLTLTLLVCALMINYATCSPMCKVGDANSKTIDCSTINLSRCYELKVGSKVSYGCDNKDGTVCNALKKLQELVGGSASCTNAAPVVFAATKLMVIPALVLILKRFF